VRACLRQPFAILRGAILVAPRPDLRTVWSFPILGCIRSYGYELASFE
jgi:hypothetical protein